MTRLQFLIRRFRDRPSRLPAYVWSRVGGRISPIYQRTRVVLFAGSDGLALGDNLMLTTVAREIKKRSSKTEIEVLTGRPEIFDRNPDIDLVTAIAVGDRSRTSKRTISYKHRFPYEKHFLNYCCECVNLTGAIDLRTYIYPSALDLEWADSLLAGLDVPPVLFGRSGGSHVYRKNWPREYWIDLAGKLAGSAHIFDVGAGGEALDLSADRYTCLLGQTNIHRLAALMARSRAFIGMDSGPVHLAAAFHLPTVCILGGVFPPVAIQYPHARILASRPSCCDCAPLRQCDFGAKCMSDIKVSHVVEALTELCPSFEFALRRNAAAFKAACGKSRTGNGLLTS